jgi:pyruvate kinase
MDYPEITLLKRRRTKIVATAGPASREPSVIEDLIRAGVNVFRLNMSHGDHAEHEAVYQRIRAMACKLGEPIAILADLCGPKIRVGRFTGGMIQLVPGNQVTVTTREVNGGPDLIPSQYSRLAADVRHGNRILLDDGMLELRVESVSGTEIQCQIIYGGVLKDHKGMNLPGVAISAASLTDKDREDARFVLQLGVDLLALSFVRCASDVAELRTVVINSGQATPIIAKIEKPEAFDEIDAILDLADGIMVARGDLGVELPPEVVPIAQHQLVAQARARNKPVIIATQMLESMIEHPRPTRAEVSDVSHAVFSGADAVMLSAETASGAYPLLAVQMMDRVARQMEGWQWTEGAFRCIARPEDLHPPLTIPQAIARATAQLSRDLRVRTLIVLSRTGATAAVVAGARPAAPIIAAAMDPATCRRMNLLWGVVPTLVNSDELKHPHALARKLATDYGLASEGQYLLLVAGIKNEEDKSEPAITVLGV